MPSKNFKELTDDKIKKFINALHKKYLYYLADYFNVKEDDLNRFSWTGQKKINIYLIKVYSHDAFKDQDTYLFCITPTTSEYNKVLSIDYVSETKTYEFDQLNYISKLNWLGTKKLISAKLLKNFLP